MWIYFHQKIIRNGKIHSSALIRTGVTTRKGIVKIEEVLKKMTSGVEVPLLPDWAKAWVKADEIHPKF